MIVWGLACCEEKSFKIEIQSPNRKQSLKYFSKNYDKINTEIIIEATQTDKERII